MLLKLQLLTKRFNVTSSLLHNLFKTCRSCGIKVQDVDPKKPGFYQISSKDRSKAIHLKAPTHWKTKGDQIKKYYKAEDDVFHKHFSEMSLQTQKLLLNGSTSDLRAVKNNTYINELEKYETDLLQPFKDPEESSIECKRCRDVTYRSNVNGSKNEFPTSSLLDVIQDNVPPYGKIVYIINFSDFPISLNPDIFKLRSPKEVKFVVNKTDLIFEKNATAIKYGKQFIQDYMERKFNVPARNIMVSSGLINWNMKELTEFIEDDSYLIGNVNSGKSTLLKSLLYYQGTQKKQFLTRKEQLIAEKEQDNRISRKTTIPLNRYAEKKVAKDFEKLFKSKIGPGVSYIPGYTRGVIPVKISDRKTVYDVAGFVNSKEDYDYYSLVKNPAVFKDINKGAPVYEKGFYNSEYTTVRSHRAVNIGGLVFIKMPDQTVYQARNCINMGFDVFKNIDKAFEVSLKVSNTYDNFKDRFLIFHNQKLISKLKRYVVPPHYGTIDLVIQGLGHFNLKPTGAKLTNDPIVIYAVPGLEIIIRQPITNYIAKTFTGRDAKGNPLKKENLIEKSTFGIKRFTDKEPFCSSLIETANTGVYDGREKEDCKSIAEFASKARGEEIEYDESTLITAENYHNYWSR